MTIYCGVGGEINTSTNTTCITDTTYGASDVDNIAIDFIGQYAVALMAFVTLIALVGLAVWFKVKANKLK